MLTVLIPAYNEGAGLADSVLQVLAKLDELGLDAEVLIVNDASRDNTGEVADGLVAEDRAAGRSRVRVIHHPVNQNIGGGLMTGVREARGEWMILIPADLAMDLDDLKRYMAATAEADVVVGVCPDRSDYTALRTAISWVNVAVIRTLFRMPLRQYNYISLYRVSLVRRMPLRYWHSAFVFAEVLIRARDLGARLVEVETVYVPRATGEATGANWRLIWHTAGDMLRYWGTRLRGTDERTS